jgi:hypothetical protein
VTSLFVYCGWGATTLHRDQQGIALLSVGGSFSLCEIQQNLSTFVAIKASSHGPFEEARAIDAYSPAVTEWAGEPTTEVLDRIKSGVLLRVDFNRGSVAQATALLLGEALGSNECRLATLKMEHCTYSGGEGAAGEAWKAIGSGLAKNASVVDIK